jgi:hypothetical protein
MITIKLIGGLGNQMFQYAYGRRLSIKKGEKLKLDLTFLLSRIPRKALAFRDYELDVFNINADFTLLSRIAFRFNNYMLIPQLIKNKISKFFFKDSVLDEVIDSTILEQRALQTKHNIYVSGLFDNLKYLSEIESEIKKDFSPKKELIGRNKQLAKEITNTNAIALHIRRGDQVGNGDSISESDYYQRAVDYISQNTVNPVFYIFSDEPEWVEKNLKISGQSVIVNNNKNHEAYIDMILMSFCKHHIIANSTFSWWGAWLCANQNKIVVIPKKYADTHRGLVLANWLKF